MRRALLLLFLLGSVVCRAQFVRIERLDKSTMSAAEADSFARQTLAENHVTGAQVAVINHNKLVWSAAFGLAGKDPDRPMTRNTTTWAASFTKSVFATYVMSLVERGEFNLDKPLAAQLPKPLTAYPLYAEAASLLVEDPAWPLVTPRMVLSHTTGLGNLFVFEPDRKLHLHFQPGVRFRYSGDGLNILQLVLEQKLGKPLDVLTDEALFQPLGMSRTGLAFRPDFLPDVADRFDLNEKFLARSRRNARAAGSMSTSAEDFARFLIAFQSGKILKPRTTQEMLAPKVTIRTAHQFQFGADELTEGAEAKSVGLAYGLGWGLLTSTRFGPAFFKEGHGEGAQNYAICFQRSQSCMILLTNSDNGELAFRALLEHILGDTVTPWEWEGYTPAYIAASRQNP